MEYAPRMAACRGISHCYQRPTYPDWPYSVFTMAHGRSKEECDAVLDSIADDTGIEERADALLLDRVQEDPAALLHRRPQAVGGAAQLTLWERAQRVMPGGVNSPVRAMRAIGRDPVFIERGEGAELVDVDGNRYVDWVGVVGPADRRARAPGRPQGGGAAAARGTSFGAPTEAEVLLAEEVVERVPSVDMVRMTSSGTEAAMSAVRLARAATGRDAVLKFAGAYHGHVDGLLAEAGSGLATQGIPASPGRHRGAGRRHGGSALERPPRPSSAPWPSDAVAAILCEPYPANMGLVPPEPGFLAFLREQAERRRRAARLRRGDLGLPGGPRRRAGAGGRAPRPDDPRQGDRRRAARGRLRRPRGAPAPGGAGGRRLPGRDAVGQPAGHRGRPRHAAAPRQRGLRAAREHDRGAGERACGRPPTGCRSRSRPPPGC